MDDKKEILTDENKILFLATVDSHIYYFHLPFMKLLRDMGYTVEVAASNVGFTEKIEQEGFKVYILPFSRNPLSPSNVKAFFSLLHLMKRSKYIMLHTHTPVASFLGRIAGKLACIPHIVYTAHGFHFHEYGNPLKNFIYYRLERFAGKFTDVLITINTDDYKIAKEKRIAKKVVYIKGVGVDTDKFNPLKLDIKQIENLKKEFQILDDDFLIIVVAELIKRKNIKDIIKAVSVINSSKIKLLLVGNGILLQELKDFSKTLSIERKVFFWGQRFDVPYLLNLANTFVLTSYHEGLPKAIMEAMAMEKPVIAYNIRGVRDLIEDEVNGFLVSFGDIKGLANKIIYLMENPEIAKEMGKRGREKIEKEFSLKVILPQMGKLYKEILEPQGLVTEDER